MTPHRLDATFAALADPTRRAILARLASGEASVTELAEPFAMSQPAISKHLKVLERAGLISRGRDAQRRPRRLEATPLAEANEWLERYRQFWEGSFQRLDALLGELKTMQKKRGRTKRERRTSADGREMADVERTRSKQMKMIDSLIGEFAHEAQTTRKHLERLPGDSLDWRPHEKSFTARGLASHIVDCVSWADSIFNSDELVVDPATYRPYRAASVDDLLRTFDDKVAACTHILAGVADADLMQPWRLKMMGRVRFERPRAAVFRDFSLSHLIHHRGQLSVYLRLLNVPVPGSYGPTADERA